LRRPAVKGAAAGRRPPTVSRGWSAAKHGPISRSEAGGQPDGTAQIRTRRRRPASGAREARLFRNNRSQAALVPATFELPGDRDLIGDRLNIAPAPRPNLLEVLSALARDPGGPVAARIAGRGPDAVCVSIVTAAELRFGCIRKGPARLTAQIGAIPGAIAIAPPDVSADAGHGRLRADLESAGAPTGPDDLLIAAHALALDATLVTANVEEFGRVRDLRVANWLA
jgi:tRNA(fMet)-specific endonuclease VapC